MSITQFLRCRKASQLEGSQLILLQHTTRFVGMPVLWAQSMPRLLGNASVTDLFLLEGAMRVGNVGVKDRYPLCMHVVVKDCVDEGFAPFRYLFEIINK
jgi:hypothetical protein